MTSEKYTIVRYPDGSSYVKLNIPNHAGPYTFDTTWKVNSYEDLWHLNQYTDAVYKQGIRPKILIPCLIDQQADSRFNTDESFGLKLVLEFLSIMEADFTLFHPHSKEILLDNFEIQDNYKFILDTLWDIKKIDSDVYPAVLLDVFHKTYDNLNYDARLADNIILMSSDAGGFKPLMKLCDKLNWKGETESASKSRKFEDNESKLIQKVDRQDFGGKDILIVDDICVRGGTFIGLAKILKERNIGNLYLAISHITVQKVDPELFEVFDHVFTTNSKYNEYYIPDSKGEPIQPTNLIINKYF